MLNFTEHMKRIIQLAEHALIHVQAKNYGSAFDDLDSIRTNNEESKKQLWPYIHSSHPDKDPAGGD